METETEQKRETIVEKIKTARTWWEGKVWGVKTKQGLFKEVFTIYREEMPTPEGWHDSYYVLENTEGKVFTAGTYAPGKSPGAYKVQEGAWRIELEEEEDGLTYSRYIDKSAPCPLRLQNGHYEAFLRQLASAVGEKMIFHVLVFRINRRTPYLRSFRNGEAPIGYEERLPFVLSLKVSPNRAFKEVLEKVKKIQERKNSGLA